MLQRKRDNELRIHVLSQATERELHVASIQGCLGLCGHLQDELLRIEQILATDDPRLKVRPTVTPPTTPDSRYVPPSRHRRPQTQGMPSRHATDDPKLKVRPAVTPPTIPDLRYAQPSRRRRSQT